MYRKYIVIIISFQTNYSSRDTIPLSRTRKLNCIVMCVRIPPSWFVRRRSDSPETGSVSQTLCLTGSPAPTAVGASERGDGDENKSHTVLGVCASGLRRHCRSFRLPRRFPVAVGYDDGDDVPLPLVSSVVRSLRSLLPMSREGPPPAR